LENKGDANALFSRAIASAKTARDFMANAKIVMPPASAADFSYRVSAMHGPGYCTIGDAGGFIDPLFSSGAHIAIVSAKLASTAILRALSSEAEGNIAFDDWETRVRCASDIFTDAVRAFYNKSLMRYLFAEKQHTALRRSITSLLSGDVFDPSARWLKDTRTRLAEMASATST
jgi:flavin-dependent dehydrogenase